ncbi:MAG: signal recognition particle receptor subunit alpha, partial [Bdellovibrionales bacterium]
MRESHADALIGLLIFVGVLILAIALPFILKTLKKSPKKELVDSEVLRAKESPALSLPIQPLSEKLKNTQNHIWGRLKLAFEGQKESEALDHVEEVLFTSDIGPKTVEALLTKVKQDLSSQEVNNFSKVVQLLKSEMSEILKPYHPFQTRWNTQGPTVFLVVGVNG